MEKEYKDINTRWFNLYYTLMLINITNSSGHLIGAISVFLTMLISILQVFNSLIIKKSMKRVSINILITSFFIIVFQIIGLTKSYGIRPYIVIIQFTAIICVIIAVIENIDINRVRMRYSNILTSIIIVLLYFEVILNTFNIKLSIIYNNTNTLAIFCQMMIFINILLYFSKKKGIKTIFIFIPPLLISKGRSALLSLIVTLIVIKLWSIISKNKLTKIISFCLVVVSVILATFVYPSIHKFEFFTNLNIWSLNMFGKELYSGREFIWSDIIQATDGNRLLGMGTGVLPREYIPWGGSAHNQYLDLMFQNGVIMCILVFLLFYLMWNWCYRFKYLGLSKATAGVIVGIIITNLFEVTLFQNNLGIGIMSWICIALGLGGLKVER